MRESGPPTTSWIPLLQALVARELVEERGFPSHRAATLIGITPSAVSQYLSGKRLSKPFLKYSTYDSYRRTARDVAESLLRSSDNPRESARILLEGALKLFGGYSSGEDRTEVLPSQSGLREGERARALVQQLRQRVRAEQSAVTACMRLAQKARDELTRAIFRQIAADSLRHAEIVASLATYLNRGVTGALASGVTRREVEAMIQAERRAERQAGTSLARNLEGTMSILVASMEADERKHAELLRGLLQSGFSRPREALHPPLHLSKTSQIKRS